MKRSSRLQATALILALALFGLCVPVARPAVAQTDLNRTMEQFDEVRALAMRGLLRVQDLKCAYLYGRGFGLDMPEAVAEDMLVEGLWLFDYLNSMDYTAMSLISYAAAAEHPNLDQELAVFRAFLPEAARNAADYYDAVGEALREALAQINAAATQRAPFTLETIALQPAPDQAIAGDGFNLGWMWPALPGEFTRLGRYLGQHTYSDERLFKLAVKAGIDFIRPEDPNMFDWPDVEREEGRFDWSRIDKLLALFKKYDIALWLTIPSYNTSPPQWLRERLKDKAVLTGPDGRPLSVRPDGGGWKTGINDIRKQNNPLNLFDPDVSEPFARYLRQLVTHVKQSGARIIAVQLADTRILPSYCGPEAQSRWQTWLEKNKIDPRKRWGMDVAAGEAPLPDKLETAGVAEPGSRQMLLDVVRWREDEYIRYFRVQVDAVRAVAPELPICVQSVDAHEQNESMNGRPNERLIRELNLASFGYANGESIWDDLRRCYSQAGCSAAPTHTGSGNAFAQYAFSSYIHGTLTVMTGPTPIARGFYWGDSFTYPDLRWRWSALGSWRRFHERAQAMGPEMLNTTPAPQVAMMWSDTSSKYQSLILDYAGGTYGYRKGAANYHKIGCVGWDRILNSLCLAHDFITEDQVRQGGLGRYEMLIMPAVQALPADVSQQIREYVQDGGIVVATSAPALFGDDMQQKAVGQLADVFGADFARFLGKSIIAESPMGTPVMNEPTFSYWDGREAGKAEAQSDSLRTLYCTFQPRQGAEVLERFTTGDPAVVLNSFGQGKTALIGYPFGRESFLSDTYHEHYGHNWADWPYGSTFQQGLFRWFELLLPRLGLEREAVVSEELVPRPIGQDAGWPCWQWTRKGGGYRDYIWKTGKMRDTTAHVGYGDAAPRSVELTFRRRAENPNVYLTIFNREGAYGFDPGVIHFEATSKEIKIELARTDVGHIYDLSLGCAVPFKTEQTAGRTRKDVATFRTMIEPSMARMIVIATEDDTIRVYSGNRRHGRDDVEIRRAVGEMATGALVPDRVVIAPAEVTGFLAERGPEGITISAESPTYLPAARRLAPALQQAFGKEVRITRNSPRILGKHRGLGVWRDESHTVIEQPDILLGSHNESHYIAQQIVSPGRGHAAPLPIMTSHTFPGPGRSVIALLRPFRKREIQGRPGERKIFVEDPARPKLIIGASDVKGLEAGVENLIELIRPEPAAP